ncbi:raffinose/stachyose/melibiose transport system permease protein [Kribbella aluminosa]|uniref:Raffinose/stachyose/melibiose transport system permease protein n=1 Tax=Kribbella aluminosa TaxID=416017 RepID=A0ABS4UWT8_9ACTN|nr:sugar ABC transporter permease [Kribbella aluminosa]MBP2356107.1 raffinose/stachyose/melibiose transport system permease protein [Kribbella aluminosa]
MTLTETPVDVVAHGSGNVPKGPRVNPLDRGRKRLFGWFVAPAAILYAAFLIVPGLVTLWISVNKWPGAGPMTFVGVGNYRAIFKDPTFVASFRNTLTILFGVGIVTFLLAFVMMLTLRDLRGRKFIRMVIFFPNIAPGVLLAIVWGFLFQQKGMINQALGWLGVAHPPAWLAEDTLFLVVMAGLVWISTGFYTTILMAAVDRIPPHLFEECELAGATAFQRLRYVILPLTWDVIGVASILWTISSIKIFEFLYAFAGGAGYLPPLKIWNTSIYAYAEAFAAVGTPRFGTAAATSVVMMVLVIAAVGLLGRLFRRDPIEL